MFLIKSWCMRNTSTMNKYLYMWSSTHTYMNCDVYEFFLSSFAICCQVFLCWTTVFFSMPLITNTLLDMIEVFTFFPWHVDLNIVVFWISTTLVIAVVGIAENSFWIKNWCMEIHQPWINICLTTAWKFVTCVWMVMFMGAS